MAAHWRVAQQLLESLPHGLTVDQTLKKAEVYALLALSDSGVDTALTSIGEAVEQLAGETGEMSLALNSIGKAIKE